MKVQDSIVDFSELEYKRELRDRALYPWSEANYMMGGICRGELIVIAGEPGSGKTTLTSNIVENMIKDGDKVMCVFGEGTMEDQQNKMYNQMTPYNPNNYEYIKFNKNNKETNIGGYFVSKGNEELIKSMTKGKLYLYGCEYGMTAERILESMEYARANLGINYFVLDNLSQIDLITTSENKELKDNMEQFRRWLIDKDTAIIALAHYRKPQEKQQIRRILAEIMGTSAIGQKASTAFNIIRTDNIDRTDKPYKSLVKILEANGYDGDEIDKASAIVEVLKTRYGKLGFFLLGFNRTTQTYFEIKKKNQKNKNSIVQNDDKPILYTQKEEQLELITDQNLLDELPF